MTLFISIAFYVTNYCWRVLLLMFGRQLSPTGVVVYYHAIKDEERNAFAKQMDLLVRLTTPIAIDRVVPLLPNKKYSAVTFDDGFENTIRNAVPELTKRGIPATIFVTADLLGEFASWWPESAPERCERIGSAERLRQLPAELICIGSHTLTHPRLPALSEASARRELMQSRIKLENLFERPVKTFSFPYGNFNAQLVAWCRDAGYERVFTTLPLMAFSAPKEFAVGRVSVEPTDWPLEFRLKVLGAYRWLPLAFRVKRRILSSGFISKVRDLETSSMRN
ncbi:MAG: polysaccharide deacetylase family protein [Terriglobales bacterium]